MKKHIFWAMFATFITLMTLTVSAKEIIKADNGDDLCLGSSWVGGVAPGPNDIAVWDGAYSVRTYSLGDDVEWLGIDVKTDPGGNIEFKAGNLLTLGEEGISIFTSPNNRFTRLRNELELNADQIWEFQRDSFYLGGLCLNGHTLTLAGGGAKEFGGAITDEGSLVLSRGSTKFSHGTAATDTAIYINNGASLNFNATPAVGGADRAASLTLCGAGNDSARASLHVTGVNNADTADVITGALTIDIGQAYVNINPNAARPALLTAGSFVRKPGSQVLFRGKGLGLNTLDSPAPGDGNISFVTAPDLLGGGGEKDSTTISILQSAYGNNIDRNGRGLGLVTYDSVYGVRQLDTATEFTPSISDGQTQLDNVRIVNTSGSGIVTNMLTADTVINSLSVDITGEGTDSGVVIAGDAPDRVLTLASGTLFSRQIVSTATASDAVVISNLVLDLNGQEGIIISANQNTYNQGNTPAPLYIYAPITNDGGNGVTIGAIGGHQSHVQFIGPELHTYTGPTILVSGYLRLNKTIPNTGIPGDLIINNGVVLTNNDSVPDDADVTINGGTFNFDNTLSSGNNGRRETINNLYMNGGTLRYNSGVNHTFNINGDAVINAQDLRLNTGGDITVAGTTTLNGGRILVSLSSSTLVNNAWFTFNDIVITNIARGVYSPIVLKSHASNYGGQLTLQGTLTFVGNDINKNTALFDFENATLEQQGIIALDGTRTFDIGAGAADVDVQVNVAIADNVETVGTLVKTGEGVLALNGINTFTGGTILDEGEIRLTGSMISPMEVNSGAVLGGSGIISNSVDFAQGAALRVNILDEDTAEVLVVTESVTGEVDVIVPDELPGGEQEWLVMTADSLSAAFKSTNPLYGVYKRNGGKELWLTRKLGNTLIIR
jgi:autotransporter-associated beta strand protein